MSMTKQDLLTRMSAVLDELSTYIITIRTKIVFPSDVKVVDINEFTHFQLNCNSFFNKVDSIMESLDRLTEDLVNYDTDEEVPYMVYQPCFNTISNYMDQVVQASTFHLDQLERMTNHNISA